ncbi:hypothetical protein GE21DRAFT_8200 [Neurospora crassa]|uniref:Uncharacterized protein n=2 Tax=Neurospora crassa TaxID=5141 RepID=Q1K7D1_NEUCR|nr:hypothetical protein NCU04206 [Neurospora crassa OR74A]EAA31930.1 hypothetical protein NCU04206 [Neurospora crassa OR74A]KHE86056.1 hypothetical protein GE21DRAFT_8200 [Neurospora crassa]CAD36983.1 hypothetical protein [Neurospora crassa]|eukprot:XP_961166.1 hypothetical protein NCU04206 [Neurospora crassa OR74A]
MSFHPRPQLLNLGVVVSRSRLGPSRGHTNELVFSQLFIPTRSTTRVSTRKSRFSTTSTTSTPRSNHHHRPRSHQYHHHHHHHYRHQQQTRHNSTHSSNSSNPNPSNPNANNVNEARITRLLSRLPRFLHPYLSSLRSSPSSFVVAFLILHEITAVVPGLGFFYLFHYCGGDDDDKEEDDKDKEGSKEGSYGKRFEEWVMGWMMELGYSEVMVKKMEGFERWFKRKGYFGFERENGDGEEGEGKGEEKGKKNGEKKGEGEGEGRKEQVLMMKKWQSGGDEKYRVLVDAALAYAITKALLPVRIIASVQATPWFAGVLGRVRSVFGGGLRK